MNTPNTTEGALILRVLEAVKAKKLTEQQADAFLQSECKITLARAEEIADPHLSRRKTIARATAIIVLLFIGSLFIIQNGTTPAGFATFQASTTTQANTTYPISENLTELTLNGTLTGEGSATFWYDTGTYKLYVGKITSNDGTPRTAQSSYSPGDSVVIENAPTQSSYYLDDGTQAVNINPPFAAPAASATVLIVANESGTLTTYHIPIIIGSQRRITEFHNLCRETCNMPPSNGTLIIELEGDVSTDVQAYGHTPAENRPPVLTDPFAPIIVNGTTTITLGGHFTDPDGDDLLYSPGLSDLVTTQVVGDKLTLTAKNSGSELFMIYASDLHDLVSTSTTIIVTMPTVQGEENTTIANSTEENTTITNATQPADDNTTAIANNDTAPQPHIEAPVENNTNATLDCSAGDPNERPVECLIQNSTEYFPEQDIYWENLDRTQVAKFNVLGNLLVKGTVVENSGGSPGSRDFTVGSPDHDGNVVVLAWVDSATGDLHIKGRLFEEEVSINPPAGSYSIITKRSIYLAYVDMATGDLHLRGNIIPYRRSI